MNLLAVTQVLAKLRFEEPEIVSLLGGREAVIESPLIQEFFADQAQRDLIRVLAARFADIDESIAERIRGINASDVFGELIDRAVQCDNVSEFVQSLDGITSNGDEST